eukprot:TRINITY_DN16458_c0_g1_i1.p1 TRINITY_DN16458_c0_g1~~TRINITY_DN16458_c0_g1_i1.p1  ORF type:complete len:486 (-),score=88.67 TRINITY_DN16458_c0_g1_i1:967-2424(-)
MGSVRRCLEVPVPGKSLLVRLLTPPSPVCDVGVLVALILCFCMPLTPNPSQSNGDMGTFAPLEFLEGGADGRQAGPPGEMAVVGRTGDNATADFELEQSVLGDNPVGRVKIFVYDLPAKYNKRFIKKEPRCLTHMFAAEIFFHANILSSGVRTLDPAEADWFYAPVYTTCDLTPHGLPLPFRAPRMMRSAILYISRFWPFWNRTEGADHFFIVPHDFGACFHYQEEQAMKRGIMPILARAMLVQTFGQRQHVCLGPNAIVVPPYAPPQRMQTRLIGPDTPRGTFVYFRGLFYDKNNDPEGGYYARGARASVWENFKANPLFDISTEHPASYYEDMQRALFCLCPLGWAPWSPRIVESVIFGCIPVIIADDIVLPFADAIPWDKIAVFVREKDVPQLDVILGAIGPSRIRRMQRHLASHAVKQAMLFPQPPQAGDAFHQLLNGLARRLPHPPSAFLPATAGQPLLNWSAGPPQDLKPWKPDSPIYW